VKEVIPPCKIVCTFGPWMEINGTFALYMEWFPIVEEFCSKLHWSGWCSAVLDWRDIPSYK